MQTVMTTNQGTDSILLVDANDRVVSAWTADSEVIANYVSEGDRADEWPLGEWPEGSDPAMQGESTAEALRRIETYGVECGRDGIICDSRRQEFWADCAVRG